MRWEGVEWYRMARDTPVSASFEFGFIRGISALVEYIESFKEWLLRPVTISTWSTLRWCLGCIGRHTCLSKLKYEHFYDTPKVDWAFISYIVCIWAETYRCLLRGLRNWTELYMRFPAMPLKFFSILSHIPHTIFTTHVCSSQVVCIYSHVYDLVICNYCANFVTFERGRRSASLI